MFRLRSNKASRDEFSVLLHAIRRGKFKSDKIVYKQPLSAAQINELITAISDNPFLRANLTELDLSTTNLPNKTDENASFRIANFPKLRLIKLSGRNFKHAELHNLPELFWFNASHNLLETLKTFKTPKLQYLLLAANKFTSFIASEHPSVEELDLCDNMLEVLDVTALYKLQALNVNANPLNTLLYYGAPLRRNITCHSAEFDAASKKLLSLRKLGSPENVTDESLDIADVNLESLKLTDEELTEYLKSLLQQFKLNHAPRILTQATNFLHKLYLARETSELQGFRHMPDDIIYRVATMRFQAASQTYLAYVANALYELTDAKQKQRINSFIIDASQALGNSGNVKLFKHMQNPESSLRKILAAKMQILTSVSTTKLTPSAIVSVRQSKSITPAYAAYQVMQGVGKRIYKALPVMSASSKSKVNKKVVA